jgi:excinuclease ABC subunit C
MEKEYIQNKKLPDSPGVYFFLGKNKKILYIGKATSLRDRVKSYFSTDIEFVRSPLIKKMTEEAVSLDYKETKSVLEALLLEADLIKKFSPPYNTKEKDDKSFYSIVITEEDFPVVKLIRSKDLHTLSPEPKASFGPFASPTQLKSALKIIRKIFPFRDEKCKLHAKRPCFNYSIGLCPGTCIGVIEKSCYAKRIKRLSLLLSGNVSSVIKDLTKDMKKLATEKEFEAAKILRDKVYALEHIQDIALIQSDRETKESVRIESYDIAHFGGKDMVGVMTVVTDGMTDKAEYKKFIIKNFSSSNDTGALKEILERRFSHPEWTLPQVIVVDGGPLQLSVAERVVASFGPSIKAVSVVKDEKHRPRDILGDKVAGEKYKKEILLSNAEAHRFAIAFHKKKRNKNFLV